MFAITFDLTVADTLKLDPKGVAQAYTDIGLALQVVASIWLRAGKGQRVYLRTR